jgi:hypothetical protein
LDVERRTFLDVSLHHRIKSIFFAIKHPCGPFENGDNLAAQLEKSAVTRYVAVQNTDVVVAGSEGLGTRVNDVLFR